MKLLSAVTLLLCAVCTWLTLLIGNIFVGYYMGPSVSHIVGVMGMVCVGWQIILAFNFLAQEFKQ